MKKLSLFMCVLLALNLILADIPLQTYMDRADAAGMQQEEDEPDKPAPEKPADKTTEGTTAEDAGLVDGGDEEDTEAPSSEQTDTTEATTAATTTEATTEATTAATTTEATTTEADTLVAVKLSAYEVTVVHKEKETISATLVYSSGKEVKNTGATFESSDKDIATVSKKGVITAKGVGTARITVTVAGSALTASCAVTVIPKAVTGVSLDCTEKNMEVFDTLQLTAAVTPSDATTKTVTYTSTNKKVATVDKKTGLVTAKGLGEAVITATTKDGGFTAACIITINQTYFDVTKFGAKNTGKTKDAAANSTAIKKALAMAKQTDEMITVYIPGGTYYINNTLYIYSNTNLLLAEDAVVKRTKDAGSKHMMRSKAEYTVDAKKDKGGYTHCQNICISGGVWDGNVDGKTSNDNIYIGHARNVTIRDTVIKNNSGAHLLEFAGVKNGLIDNVELYGFKRCTGKGYTYGIQEYKEAIQIDYCSKLTTPGMIPWDNTPCKDITIQNCYIHNYMCGIGSHESKSGVYHKNIVIQNNNFYKITNVCMDMRNYRNLTVKENQASGFQVFMYGLNARGTITDNMAVNISFNRLSKYRLFTGNGISLCGASNFKIFRNTFSKCRASGISMWGNSVATIKDNTLSANSNVGVRTYASKVTLANNVVENNKKGYAEVDKASKVKADDIRAYFVEPLEASYEFTGKALKPKIVIKGLKNGKHFEVTYEDNKELGEATVTITGIGTMKGEIILKFKIVNPAAKSKKKKKK